jgi:hypothetical protein
MSSFSVENNIFIYYKTSYLNEEANCTVPFPSVSIPWHFVSIFFVSKFLKPPFFHFLSCSSCFELSIDGRPKTGTTKHFLSCNLLKLRCNKLVRSSEPFQVLIFAFPIHSSLSLPRKDATLCVWSCIHSTLFSS